ncbi:MAG: metallophosphoesterase [Halofilum sp. (in: g-proteobacteria)]|nr:metallophosphoesterase [Halofilum sp. (in: g-proteobacteria)]
MRIQVLSDLHAEVDPKRAQSDVVDLGADLVILAGDIDHGGAGVRWAARPGRTRRSSTCSAITSTTDPRSMPATEHARAAAAGTHVHVLEREAITIQGVRILGATLWTDLALAGDIAFTRWRLGQAFTDYRAIEGADGRSLRPAETEAIHHETVKWLEQTLAEPHSGPTIVVTHHAPSPHSLGQRGEAPQAATSAAYASDLESLIERHSPTIWVHGHTHYSCDYRIGDTCVVSNQRGYYAEKTGWDSSYVLDLTGVRPV